MKVLYYDCFAGISGDMNLGAMIDLGIDAGYLRGRLELLGLEGYQLMVKKDTRRGISGTRAEVALTGSSERHRNIHDIEGIISGSGLNAVEKDLGLRMFHKLAEAEARVHGIAVDKVHFHEVGAVDSIVDIVGAAVCRAALDVDKVLCGPVELGSGLAVCAHGTFPVPAPATAELLKGVVVKSGAVPFEATTPTGAVILAALVDEFSGMKDLTVTGSGYGLGHKDAEVPNALRVFTGIVPGGAAPADHCLLECNIDDMNPELYESAMERLFALGADDVFLTPIIMKKGRPAVQVSVLCDSAREPFLRDALLETTTSFGLRRTAVDKTALERSFVTVRSPYGDVRVKQAFLKGRRLKAKPEYEDCRRLADEKGVPVMEVYLDVLSRLKND